jgi:ATP-dependent helicase Lhr and Lhr-like helicase
VSAFEHLHPSIQYHIVNSLGWSTLRPTQLEAIDPLLNGRDALLLAPTAGGKTEAAIFPILSRMLSERWSGLSVLYVCPLRALLNNVEFRLTHYAGLVGRSVALWHGGIRAGGKRLSLKTPPDLLLTTPESIESILISRVVDHHALFASLRAVVIDEAHAFASDDRGCHLLALLERLDRIAGRHLQRVGLSATVGNPDAVAAWLAQTPEACVIGRSAIMTNGDVTVDYVGSIENAARVLARLFRGEKRLVFCDSRARVESLAVQLRQLGLQTFVCHSSLSDDERRQAERAFVQASDCVIVATSTLELGIDIGDLDRVIQIDAPISVSSFLQRMGRTGRRIGAIRNCLFLTTTDEALLTAAGLVELWRSGFVENAIPPPRPLHIAAQQILALVLQERGLPENGWRSWLEKTFAWVKPGEIEHLIEYMKRLDLLVEDQGLLGVGPAAEASLGRRNFLELMSAFTTPLLISVRHGNTELGEVAPITLSGAQESSTAILLGGRSWRIANIDWNKRLAWVQPSVERGKSSWPGSSKLMHYQLCRAIEAGLVSRGGEIPFSQRARTHYDTLCDAFEFCDGKSIPAVRYTLQRGRLWTFAGSRVNGPLSQAFTKRGFGGGEFDNFSVSVSKGAIGFSSDVLRGLSVSELYPTVTSSLSRTLKFSNCLPHAQAADIISERLRDENGLRETLARPVREIVMAE